MVRDGTNGGKLLRLLAGTGANMPRCWKKFSESFFVMETATKK